MLGRLVASFLVVLKQNYLKHFMSSYIFSAVKYDYETPNLFESNRIQTYVIKVLGLRKQRHL